MTKQKTIVNQDAELHDKEVNEFLEILVNVIKVENFVIPGSCEKHSTPTLYTTVTYGGNFE